MTCYIINQQQTAHRHPVSYHTQVRASHPTGRHRACLPHTGAGAPACGSVPPRDPQPPHTTTARTTRPKGGTRIDTRLAHDRQLCRAVARERRDDCRPCVQLCCSGNTQAPTLGTLRLHTCLFVHASKPSTTQQRHPPNDKLETQPHSSITHKPAADDSLKNNSARVSPQKTQWIRCGELWCAHARAAQPPTPCRHRHTHATKSLFRLLRFFLLVLPQGHTPSLC